MPLAAEKRERTPDRKLKDRLAEIAEQVQLDRLRDTPERQRNIEVIVSGQQNPDGHHIVAQALRYVPGGRATFVDLVRRAALNGDNHAKTWWMIFTQLNESQQNRVDFDDICEASGVRPDVIMGVVVSNAIRMGSDVADLIAATTQPAVVRQTVKSAMRIGGKHAGIAQKDREMLHQHSKFIPIPRGSSVTVHATAHAAAASQAAATAPSLPSFSQSLNGAQSANDAVQRVIADRSVDAEFVDAI